MRPRNRIPADGGSPDLGATRGGSKETRNGCTVHDPEPEGVPSWVASAAATAAPTGLAVTADPMALPELVAPDATRPVGGRASMRTSTLRITSDAFSNLVALRPNFVAAAFPCATFFALVAAMCDRGRRVVFDSDGRYIQDRRTGHRTPFERETGVYHLSIQIPSPLSTHGCKPLAPVERSSNSGARAANRLFFARLAPFLP